jgi:D-glycero-alpha-D-manno-heptose 1-phosphate guanylyltransferase
MAQIGNKHFLEYVLLYLQRSSIEHVILSAGYKAEIIQNYFGNTYQGLRISYSIEEKLLGTGGAIAFSLRTATDEDVLIMNGDTMFPVPIADFYEYHCAKKNTTLTMALKKIDKTDRYGTVDIDMNGKVIGFEEKKYIESGLINGGVYILNRIKFGNKKYPEIFSLERQFLQEYYQCGEIYGKAYNDYFIDIGIPEDYFKAMEILPKLYPIDGEKQSP